MAKKGHNYKQKRLSVSPVRHLARKDRTWTIKQYPGAHSGNQSVPIAFVLREMLGLAQTLREAKSILHKGYVLVDGAVVKEPKYAVGLLDSISIPETKKNYRLVYDLKGRLVIREADAKTTMQKVSRVVRKSIVTGNKTLVQTHDGYTYAGETKIKVGDSIIANLTDGKIMEHLPLQKGNAVYIIGGTHVGEVAKVEGIVEGTMKRDKLVDLSEGKEKFQTTARNVMVIDETLLGWMKQSMHGGDKV